MHILYLHQYFKTPQEGGAIRSFYLAKGLVNNGYRVSMVSSHNENKYVQKNIEGIEVHYLPVYYDNKLGFYGRIYAFLKFIFLACQLIGKISKSDKVNKIYATSTPLTIGLVALWAKKIYKLTYFFEVRDLWPEAPIQLRFIRNPSLKKLLYGLESTIYNHADKIVALSPGIKQYIKRIVPEKEITLIPNMSDCEFFKQEEKQEALEVKYQVRNKFVVSYFGAAGEVNHLEYVLDAAKQCVKLPIHFLITAEGSELSRIKELAKSMKLKNLSFFPYKNKSGIKEVLNVTDAVYISFANFPILETNSPNKFFDGLSSGKLLIVNSKGWTKNIVINRNCGFYHNPNTESFSNAILPFLLDKDLLSEHQF
ncbi:glycosyltransferase family 4 protein, partial [Xanthovirga aplysinae]|uniref:glycosyltransferase family 4 protein n=1 Tax=Xanthovirga aplysinae TaxID=2529853 RepID=UPI0012BD08D0